ncbi:MAG: hypothetical protein ACODAJ_05555 [Planctomycetota bacterium]
MRHDPTAARAAGLIRARYAVDWSGLTEQQILDAMEDLVARARSAARHHGRACLRHAAADLGAAALALLADHCPDRANSTPTISGRPPLSPK